MCRSQTTAASKLLPTGLPCGMARSRPLTLPSSALSPGLAKRSQGLPCNPAGPLRQPPDASGARRTPACARARCCRLVVVGVEVGGRFGNEATTWLRLLAQHKASAVPAALRPAVRSAWVARWSGLLAVAAQRAFATTLLELPLAGERNVAGDAPELHLLATAAALETRNQGQKDASRARAGHWRWRQAAAIPAKRHQTLVRLVVPAGAAKTPRQGAQTLARGGKQPHGARQGWGGRRLPKPARRQPGGRRRRGLACGWLVNSQPKRPNRQPGRSQQLTAGPARRIAAASARRDRRTPATEAAGPGTTEWQGSCAQPHHVGGQTLPLLRGGSMRSR